MSADWNWYRSVVENLPVVVYVDLSGEGKAAVYVSPQIEGLLGYFQEEWLSDAGLWRRILHRDDRKRVLTEIIHVRNAGSIFSLEYRLRARDGRTVWVRDEAAPALNKEGRAGSWRGVMLDITAQKEAEEKLRESESRFDTVFGTSEVGMAQVALDGRWLMVNDTLCEMLGYTGEELLALTFWNLTPEEEISLARERVASLLSGKLKSYSAERLFTRKGGSRLWVEIAILLLRDSSGRPDYFFGRFRDVTERRLAELVPEPLTNGEMEVLRLLSQGHTNQQIADELRYSVGNIKHRVQGIIRKLGVGDRRYAVVRAEEIGLIPPPH